MPNTEEIINNKNKENDKDKKPAKWIVPLVIAILLIAVSIVDAKVATVIHFAEGSKINGVDVSGMTISEATQSLEASLNSTKLIVDTVEKGTINTEFKYGNAVQLHSRLVLSHLDPRTEKNYYMGLNVIAGVDACSSDVLAIIPPQKGETQTANAYIDYNEMKIVSEVQGNNLNYTAIANAIAAQRKTEPTADRFTMAKSDYYVEPNIVAEDLEEECKWAAEHLTQGIDVENPQGIITHIYAPQMASLVLYNDGNIEYSNEGAMALADTMAGDEIPDTLSVKTQNGVKELNNYALPLSVDREKSAKSILKSAKASVEGEEPVVAKIYTNAKQSVDLPDHVEVSIEQQKLWLVQNGKVTLESPVVTGMYRVHDTSHGIFKIKFKLSPTTLRGDNGDGTEYASYVDYWMPFNGGVGLHDAMWRSSFGGNIYKGDGSHGCVNCPHAVAEKLYKTLEVGSIVVVY